MWMWLNICRRSVKYDRFVAIRRVFSSSKYSKTRFRPEFCPGPQWESLQRSPRPLVGWGGGTPLPIPFPDGEGNGEGCPPPHSLPRRRLRRLDLGALVVRPPPTQIPGYAYAPLKTRYIDVRHLDCKWKLRDSKQDKCDADKCDAAMLQLTQYIILWRWWLGGRKGIQHVNNALQHPLIIRYYSKNVSNP